MCLNQNWLFSSPKEAYRFRLIECTVPIEDIAIKLIRANTNMSYKLRSFVEKGG